MNATLKFFRQKIEEARVSRAHRGWRKTVQSVGFGLWLEFQPRSLRNLVRSESAADAIKLLNAYRDWATDK